MKKFHLCLSCISNKHWRMVITCLSVSLVCFLVANGVAIASGIPVEVLDVPGTNIKIPMTPQGFMGFVMGGLATYAFFYHHDMKPMKERLGQLEADRDARFEKMEQELDRLRKSGGAM